MTTSQIYEDGRGEPNMEPSQELIHSPKLPPTLNRSKLPDFIRNTLKASSSHIRPAIK